MKATYKLENLGDVEATLTVTMRIKDWQDLEKQIADRHPGWKFTDAIKDLVRHASATFEAPGDAGDEP